MHLRIASILAVSFLFCLTVAHAQYVEIYRLDNLVKDLPDSQVISSLASDLSVPEDRLKQEKAEYKVTYGELYLGHRFARAANSDFKSLIADVRKTGGGTVAVDRKIDMDEIKESTKKLEKALKDASNT